MTISNCLSTSLIVGLWEASTLVMLLTSGLRNSKHRDFYDTFKQTINADSILVDLHLSILF